MYSPSASAATTTTTILLILASVAFSMCYSQEDEPYSTCLPNFNFSCGGSGTIQNLSYPFWGGDRRRFCGHPSFELKCQGNLLYPTIEIDNRAFLVNNINQSTRSITLASSDLGLNVCTQELHNITQLDVNLFQYGPINRNLFLFYNCSTSEALVTDFSCKRDEIESHGFYADETFLDEINKKNYAISCEKSVEVQVFRETVIELFNGSMPLQEVLRRGFEMVYGANETLCVRCEVSGGICGSDSNEFACHCRDRTYSETCRSPGKLGIKLGIKLAIGFGASGATLLAVGIVLFLRQRRKKTLYGTPSWISRSISLFPSSAPPDPERASTFYGVHVFKYSELEKATGNFDPEKELGDGGFGTVYQGKLKDGRDVAVKRLYQHNYKRMEQFMNEVEILARLRHQNLVALYGCTSRHSRELLLVYEYIPNGTVADHLHGDRAKPGALSWTTRMSIAVETATALTYLHNSEVVHRDVKTNNILLDNNFCVKVADFGLSRLFPTNVTHVSTAPQGTPGYVDPEYHECYQLTSKSDVYSFGVVLIELISSKPAVDITRHRHEINLSTMAVNKIQNHALHEIIDPSLGFETDYMVREMIGEVAELAFQCLQSEKDMRPSMETVLETLKGIQSQDWKLRKPEEVEIPCDEVALLKSDPPTLSPDSLAKGSMSARLGRDRSSERIEIDVNST